ncbi:hypothetical protein [Arthrobacter humicola]|nr:hypothetical protein [Arthrobacter humicola]
MQDSPTLGSAEGIDWVWGEIDEEETVIAEAFQPGTLPGSL